MRKNARKTASSSKNTARKASGARKVAAAALEQLEDRKLFSASFAIGIGVNDGSSSFMNAASGKLKSLGVQTVRLYMSTDFSSHPTSGVVQRAIDYSNRGFDVMLCVVPQNGNVYSPDKVSSWFQWAMGQSSLKNAVDRWEIGNEPDHSQYWKGSMGQYVTQLLKPAYEVLHANGEQVVSAGPSWDSQDVQDMINNGLLDYTDYIGYHPYANGVKLVETRLSQIKAVVQGRKPLVASEWNVRGLEGNPSAWAAADQQIYKDIADTFAINYYYAAEKVNSPAGPAGLMYSNGAPNQPFWNAFATFRGANADPGSGNTDTGTGSTDTGSTGTGSTDTGSTSTPPPASTGNTGNTAAGGNSSIAGTLFNDTDGDGKWDNGEVATGARTVFIDSNGNGRLDGGEKSTMAAANGTFKFTGLGSGKYNVTRVFPAGFHLSSTTAKDMVVTVNPGQQVTGLNIGTSNKPVGSTSTPSTPTTTPTTPPPSSTGTTVVANGPTTGSLKFVDSKGNGIAGLNYVTGNKVVSLASLSTLDVAVVAVASANTGSMNLTLNGSTREDDQLGFTFLPETNRNYTTFHLKAGKYVFSTQAFNGKGAVGTAGAVKTFTITFA